MSRTRTHLSQLTLQPIWPNHPTLRQMSSSDPKIERVTILYSDVVLDIAIIERQCLVLEGKINSSIQIGELERLRTIIKSLSSRALRQLNGVDIKPMIEGSPIELASLFLEQCTQNQN